MEQAEKCGAVAAASNRFALGLQAQLRGEAGNLFLSPFSVFCALAMTHAGAQGETAAQMASTLHLPAGAGRHDDIGAVLRALAGGEGGSYRLHVANALWVKTGFRFVEGFARLMREAYGASAQEADFDDPVGACDAINAWAAKQTHGRIPRLLSPMSIRDLTRLVLANAIYFKAEWQMTFDRDRTEEAEFFVSAQRGVRVPMMRQQAYFSCADLGAFRVLELPYERGELCMRIALPKEVDGLRALEGEMAGALLGDGTPERRFRWQDTRLYLPRFRVESGFALSGVLKRMGMPRAFDSENAEFRGMIANDALCISEVVHKAFVEVNEEGTEAAAATAVVMDSLGAMDAEEEPVTFRVDRPFLFLIRHRGSGTALFLGRVADPS